ncbi:AAA family ATPase [Roseivirga sp. BDSF3-8]|uniref:AAA family ATPase n=1 Tax=Roseivirga sp. BDSF3-8 TaxID=3241598 RepID=UPI0035325D94
MDLKELKALAERYHRYISKDPALYEDLNVLPLEVKEQLKHAYEGEGLGHQPVNLLRYILLHKLTEGETLTPGTVDKVKEDLEQRDLGAYDFLDEQVRQDFQNLPEKSRSPFAMWSNAANVLFPFFNRPEEREDVKDLLVSLVDDIIRELSLQEVSTHVVDFRGSRQQGVGWVWAAIYPNTAKSHKDAYQLFFSITHKGLRAGIAKGHDIKGGHPGNISENLPLDRDRLIEHMQSLKAEWLRLNEGLKESNNQSQPQTAYEAPLNQIFYGPPGTGKTYHTISEAVKIVEELSEEEFLEKYTDRDELKETYNRYASEGQIAFCTFHQSMGYEDFVEGIKPELVSGSEAEQGQQVAYEVKDGIFKALCKNAEGYLSTKKTLDEEEQSDISREDFSKGAFYKMSLGNTQSQDGDAIYKYCLKHGVIALGWGDDTDFTAAEHEGEIKRIVKEQAINETVPRFMKPFRLYMNEGDYVVISNGNLKFRAIAKITGDYEYRDDTEIDFHHFRKVKWLLKDIDLPHGKLYENQFSQSTLYKLDSDLIKKDFFEPFKKQEDKAPDFFRRNFVLIIDEINRGNVSQIFGELITLLEADKRKGNSEALELTLPYSQKPFGIPNNLYLVGTMNTADRSVEALDTALRRRFMFREMPPDPDLLAPERAILNILENEKDISDLKKQSLYQFIGLGNNTEVRAKALRLLPRLEALKWIREGYDDESVMAPEDVLDGKDLELTGINLNKMLQAINYRLEKLLDRDHAIGHAYFLGVYEADNPLAALKQTFQKNIIPLLQEYFYGDYGKIGLVLGRAFVKVRETEGHGFAAFDDMHSDLRQDYEERRVYHLTGPDSWKKEDFIAIYE